MTYFLARIYHAINHNPMVAEKEKNLSIALWIKPKAFATVNKGQRQGHHKDNVPQNILYIKSQFLLQNSVK